MKISQTFSATFVTAIALIASTGARSAECGWIANQLGVCQAVDTVNARLTEITKVVDTLGKDAVKAIPGERWLQLIDQLNSGDPVARSKAQAYLSSIAGLKITDASDISNYVLSVGFSFDENKTFNTRVWTFEEPDPRLLREHLLYGPQLERPTKFVFDPINRDEVRKRLLAIADRVVLGFVPIKAEALHERPECQVGIPLDPYCAKFSFPETLGLGSEVVVSGLGGAASFERMKADLAKGPPAYNKRRSDIQAALADLVLEAISYHASRSDTKEMSLDWPVLTNRKFAVIFIDKQTYDEQADFTVKMRVNKRDKPEEKLGGMPEFVLHKKDFTPREINPLIKGRNDEVFYWTSGEMTGAIGQAITRVQEMADLRSAIEQFEKRRAGQQ